MCKILYIAAFLMVGEEDLLKMQLLAEWTYKNVKWLLKLKGTVSFPFNRKHTGILYASWQGEST